MTRQERLNTPVAEMGRVNIRAYIKRRLQEEGISHYALADALGTARQNINAALNEKIPMPLERMEKILWILDGDNTPFHG